VCWTSYLAIAGLSTSQVAQLHRSVQSLRGGRGGGRATEVVTAEQALTSGSVRLLTLTGTGGVGKTHLALEIGRTLAGKFADGVYWVDLAPLSNTQLVLPTIARTLGLTDPGQIPVGEQVQVFCSRGICC
jgi:hypothetical protein